MVEILIFIIALTIVLMIYFWLVYTLVFKGNREKFKLQKFYTAINSIYEDAMDAPLEDIYSQVSLNFKKLCESYPTDKFADILETIETLISLHDSENNQRFKTIVRQQKKPEIKAFLWSVRSYIKEVDPFISVPAKDADLLSTIKEALRSGNDALGMNALSQLSQEIESKEKLAKRRIKENQLARVISIVGIVLTIFFGLISFINALPY